MFHVEHFPDHWAFPADGGLRTGEECSTWNNFWPALGAKMGVAGHEKCSTWNNVTTNTLVSSDLPIIWSVCAKGQQRRSGRREEAQLNERTGR